MRKFTVIKIVVLILLLGTTLLFKVSGDIRVKKFGGNDSTIAYMDGDLIFQINVGGQGKAVQLATGSKYTHVGMIINENGKLMVAEAVQPVKLTPLKEFISRGDKDQYVVKRLANRSKYISDSIAIEMRKTAKAYTGKNYDLYFGWDEELIYCSELVWKIYNKHTGLEIGKLQKLKEFKLDHPIVKEKLKERYGNKIPYEEKCISPGAMFDSPLLKTIDSK